MCFKLGIKLIKKMLSQRDDVFFALAKRRNFQIDNIQAIIKVGTEFIGISPISSRNNVPPLATSK